MQVREADENDPYREKTVQLLDDFKVSGVNGTRILVDDALIELNWPSLTVDFQTAITSCTEFYCIIVQK